MGSWWPAQGPRPADHQTPLNSLTAAPSLRVFQGLEQLVLLGSRQLIEGQDHPGQAFIASEQVVLWHSQRGWPIAAALARHQGTVIVRVLVKEDSTVGYVQLVSSSGFEKLDQAASAR